MTDIVERLRNPLIIIRAMALRMEAADEIERLREHVDALRLVATAHEPEVERLRAALVEIEGYLERWADEPECGKFFEIARRALEPKP